MPASQKLMIISRDDRKIDDMLKNIATKSSNSKKVPDKIIEKLYYLEDRFLSSELSESTRNNISVNAIC